MKRALSVFLCTLFLVVGSPLVQGASAPPIAGDVFGVEFCPQSGCGAAIFGGVFSGRVGGNAHAFGIMAVAVNHEDPLPEPGEFAAITGGLWELRASRQRFRGIITEGSLFNNGDNTYSAEATLLLTQGGFGELFLEVLLDHNVFPPTVHGRILQSPTTITE
jgi:hypothetical protein